MEWQPIETAPKGEGVLLYRADAGVFVGIFTSLSEFASEQECDDLDEETLFSEDWFGGDWIGTYRLDGTEAPTHWMPLPANP